MSPTRRVSVEYPEYPLTLRNLRLALAGREGRPMQQLEAAKKAKIASASLSNIERGNQPASQYLLFRLSEVYQVELQIVREAYRGSREKLDDPVGSRNTKSQLSTKRAKSKR